MTENRKRVTVAVSGSSRSVTIRAPAQIVMNRVTVDALPVRRVDTDPYDGPYEVEPDFTGQTLATNGLRMTDDVTINPIYLADTSNPAGGTTVYIGGEFIG